MPVRKNSTKNSHLDPADDAPELDRAWFEGADHYKKGKLVRRGRPLGSTKTRIDVRLDNDIVEYYRSSGPGWQTRLNAALRDTLPL
jgi:uncharacterized protein (DUF4415 family)